MKGSSKHGGDGNPREETEKEAVKTTIVGGRPPGQGRGYGAIPHGIDVLMKKASIDPAFRKLLLDKRSQVASEIDLELSSTEAAMLNSISQSQLNHVIEKTTVPNEHRRIFLSKAGAAMLALFSLELSACTTGIRPDSDYLSKKPNKLPRIRGVQPDDPQSRNESGKSLPEQDDPRK